MTRLKLPPYGRQLLERRRAGDHPLEVALIYGHDWRADVGGVPRVALNPEDYVPGKYDFGFLAGLRVTIHDQDLNADECNPTTTPPTYGKFYDLIAEVAKFVACLDLRWPARSGWPPREAAEFARCCRWHDHAAGRMQWPRWWSDALAAEYTRRWPAWLEDSAIAHGIIEPERAEA